MNTKKQSTAKKRWGKEEFLTIIMEGKGNTATTEIQRATTPFSTEIAGFWGGGGE